MSDFKLALCCDSTITTSGSYFPVNGSCIRPSSGHSSIGLSPAKQYVPEYMLQASVPFTLKVLKLFGREGINVSLLWVVDGSDTYATQNCDVGCNASDLAEREIKKLAGECVSLTTFQANCALGEMTKAQEWATQTSDLDLETQQKLLRIQAQILEDSNFSHHAVMMNLLSPVYKLGLAKDLVLPVPEEELIVPWKLAA